MQIRDLHAKIAFKVCLDSDTWALTNCECSCVSALLFYTELTECAASVLLISNSYSSVTKLHQLLTLQILTGAKLKLLKDAPAMAFGIQLFPVLF